MTWITKEDGDRPSPMQLPSLRRTGIYRYQVEILITIYCMASSLAYTFVQNLVIYKVCWHMDIPPPSSPPTGSDSVARQPSHEQRCTNMSNDESLEASVQQVAAQYLLVLSLVKHIPAVLVTVLMGPWSDIHGRKLCILLPFLGNAVTYAGFILTDLHPEWSAAYVILAAIPAGLTGDYAAEMMGLFSTVKDTTVVERVSMRIAIVDGVEEASRQLGRLLGAPLYTSSGNVGVFMTSFVLYSVGALASCMLLVEEDESAQAKSSCRQVASWRSKMADFFDLRNAASTLMVVTVKRKHNLRLRIAMLLLATFILQVASHGSYEIMFLYTRLVLHWDAILYNYYIVAVYGFTGISLLVVLPLCIRHLNISDGAVGFIGDIGMMGVFLSTARVSTSFGMYFASSFWLVGAITYVATRSCLSKFVESNEIGKIMGVYAILTVISANVGQIVATQIYVATLDFNPGFYFYMAALLLSINLVIFGYLYKAAKTQTVSPDHLCAT